MIQAACTTGGGGCSKVLSPTRKEQDTTTKLGIYSTYSPRSPINFLSRYYNFCKPLKKISECCPSNHISAAVTTSASEEKCQPFNSFSVQGTGDSPTGPDPENGVGVEDIGSLGWPVFSGFQVPGEPGNCRASTRLLWWNFRGLFPSKCPSIAPAEMSNTPLW
jgi:hypothetical protein